MSDLDNDPYIKALDMRLSEATQKFGIYVLVAIDIAAGRTEATGHTWRHYNQDKMKLHRELSAVEALQELIMKKLA